MISIAKNNSNYPKHLLALKDAPKNIFVRSSAKFDELLARPKVAVVGSRKVTSYGRAVTEQLVAELARHGVVIVSGLALGIDSIAHSVTIQNGGQTIAVLPCGLDHVYPSSHKSLSEKIVAHSGALVSEYQPDEKIAFKGNFIARNRIIAGLADVLLVPEAAKNSGSLHTAGFALDMGIDIFAVPGPINSPTSEGCNNLIRSGAGLATSAQDILDYLGISAKQQTQQKTLPLVDDQHQAKVIKLITESSQPLTNEELQLATKLNTSDLNQALSMLEIYGYISTNNSNRWFRK